MSGDAAWIDADLTISASVLREIEAHAIREYPSECCGFILGPADQVDSLDEARAEVNEADKYHRLDPERFPRTSRTYFKINELRAARLFESAAAEARPVKVIYHSHCDTGAYFSEEDAATFAIDGTLMWPCAFLVVSVRSGKIDDRRLWVHVPGTEDFVERALHIEST